MAIQGFGNVGAVIAKELLRSDAPFILDTSAWWRVASLPAEFGALLQAAVIDDRLWIAPIVRMEMPVGPMQRLIPPRAAS